MGGICARRRNQRGTICVRGQNWRIFVLELVNWWGAGICAGKGNLEGVVLRKWI